MFPAEYRNQIFIAEHGSWNRSKKIGYRISLVRIEGNKVVSYQPFAQGWLQGEIGLGPARGPGNPARRLAGGIRRQRRCDIPHQLFASGPR